MALYSTQSIWSTSLGSFTRVLTQQIARKVRLADSIGWTVGVAVRAFVGTATTGLSIWRTDILLRRTDAVKASDFVLTNGRSMTTVFRAIVDWYTGRHRISFVALQTPTNS